MDTPTYRNIDATALAARLGTDDEPVVLDVREPDEVAQWSIPGTRNIPLGELPNRLDALPRDREIVTLCAAGRRSARAAELLADRGFNVANLAGGMSAWGAVYDSVVIDDGDVHVVQVRRRGKGCLSYVAGAGNEAFVVDPSLAVDVYLEIAAQNGWRITRIFDTHLHADHLSGARVAAATGASLHLNPADTFNFPFVPLQDGERFGLAPDLHVSVAALRTPGHTEGSTMYFVGDRIVLTGDTLFVDGIGRPDLAERAEEYAHSLYQSLHERVLALSDDTLILPAHYGDDVPVHPDEPVGARLGALRRSLPALELDEDEFVAWAVGRVTPRPPNYVEIINANMGRTDISEPDRAGLELGPNRCAL